MTATIHERLTALCVLASDGDLEIIQRDPLRATMRIDGVTICAAAFCHQGSGLTVLDLVIPIAKRPAHPVLDRWAARLAPDLFIAHVALRDDPDGTAIDAATALLAHGLSLPTLQATLDLLLVSAREISIALHKLDLTKPPMTPHQPPQTAGQPETRTSPRETAAPQPATPQTPASMPLAPRLYPGYL